MRVLIDASAVHPTSGGAGTYLRSLVAALPGVGIEPVIIARRNDETTWKGAHSVHRVAPNRRPTRLIWEQVGLPRTVAALQRSGAVPVGPVVLHSPHYTMPLRVPRGVRRVVTIHDLTFFSRPADHERSKRLLFRFSIARAARAADVVVCVSHATADALRRTVTVSAPVVVAAHGVSVEGFRTVDELSAVERQRDEELLRDAGVAQPFVLHLGAIEPRKRVPDLIEAMRQLERDDLTLVLAGKVWDSYAATFPPAHAFERRLGYVTQDLAAALMRSTQMVVYPSAEEGFGLPVLEALACGALVVTTSNSAMSEVAGPYAELIDESNGVVDGIRAALERLLAVEPLESDRRNRQLHARTFTWQKSGEHHKNAYEMALGHTEELSRGARPGNAD